MIMMPDWEIERYELKFYINGELHEAICEMIAPYMRLDQHSEGKEDRQYSVRSLYLDNNLWDSYYENLDGLMTRRKLRIRAYGAGESSHFMEIKKKVNSAVIKRRLPVHRDFFPRMLAGDFDRDKDKNGFLSNFCFLKDHLNLKPQVLIEYEREAYMGIDASKTRVTFDRNVRAASCPHAMLYPEFTSWNEVFQEGSIILELKFDGMMPRFLREIVRELNLSHEPISKYCAGVRVCNLV